MQAGDDVAHWLGKTALAAITGCGLYLVFILYSAQQPLLALSFLAALGLLLWVYSSEKLYAWRYLFPGLAAVLVFVIFPLVYTISIGFTNYSSKNLLSFERATAVLLDETTRTEASGYTLSLHADGQEFRLQLKAQDSEETLLTPPLALRNAAALKVELQAATAKTALGEALSIKEVIAHQAALKQLTLVLPN